MAQSESPVRRAQPSPYVHLDLRSHGKTKLPAGWILLGQVFAVLSKAANGLMSPPEDRLRPPATTGMPRGEAADAQIEWLGGASHPEFQKRLDALTSGVLVETLVRLYWTALDERQEDVAVDMRARLFGRFKNGTFVVGAVEAPVPAHLKAWSREPDVMEDLRSATIAKLLTRIENRTATVSNNAWKVIGWCYRTAAKRYLKAQRKSVPLQEDDERSVAPELRTDGNEAIAELLVRADLQGLLALLPPLQRRAVELRHLEGLKWGTERNTGERTVSSEMEMTPDEVRYLIRLGVQEMTKRARAVRSDSKGA